MAAAAVDPFRELRNFLQVAGHLADHTVRVGGVPHSSQSHTQQKRFKENSQNKVSRSWYYERSGQRVGPIRDGDVQSFVIMVTLSANTLFWRCG